LGPISNGRRLDKNKNRVEKVTQAIKNIVINTAYSV
jgi:hypothetical protein